jgi:hypothetical protein
MRLASAIVIMTIRSSRMRADAGTCGGAHIALPLKFLSQRNYSDEAENAMIGGTNESNS